MKKISRRFLELKLEILEAINNAVDSNPIQDGDRLYVVRRRLSSSPCVRIDSPCPVCGGKKKKVTAQK